jgi:molecular chaperone GrpE
MMTEAAMTDPIQNADEDTVNNQAEPQPAVTEAPQPDAEAGKLAALEAEVASWKDKALRALAEVENIRRRSERDREETAKFAIRKFAADLLPVADNLRRAVESVPPGATEQDQNLKNLVDGVEATERELVTSFDRAGIKPIQAQDKQFDPNLHEAMVEIPGTDKPAGSVVQVFQGGWTLNDRLLRPARVGVAKSEPKERIVDTQA